MQAALLMIYHSERSLSRKMPLGAKFRGREEMKALLGDVRMDGRQKYKKAFLACGLND
jgi:hypothetical protein